jgi:hypothetical protein
MANGGVAVSVSWYPNAGQQLSDVADRALGQASEQILERANRQAPFLTGAMIRSSRVVEVQPGFFRIEYLVPYAAVQHQNMRFHHRHGRARWLAIELSQTDIAQTIASRVRL